MSTIIKCLMWMLVVFTILASLVGITLLVVCPHDPFSKAYFIVWTVLFVLMAVETWPRISEIFRRKKLP